MPEVGEKTTCALAEIVEAVVGTGLSDTGNRITTFPDTEEQEAWMILDRIRRDLALLENWFRATGHIDRAETALERLIRDVREEDNSHAVSEKEREVLVELAKGKTNREISVTLGKSEKTVKNHLWKIYRKLGVNNRTQLFNRLMKA